MGSCATTPAPDHPRKALPLPPAIAAHYRLPGTVEEDYLIRLDDDGRIFRGRLHCGAESPEFHLILPEQTPAPVLLCLPILAGGEWLMWYIADYMARRGYAVVWGKRVASAMQSQQTVADIEALFLRTIVHNRAVLVWSRRQPWAGDSKSLLGISTGGILGGTMLALEPELVRAVLILAGGDLPDLLQNSSERRILRWRRHRRAKDGIDPVTMRAQMRRELRSDPARVAPYVPTGKVFMVMASLDTVVPRRNRELLWEGFGRPRRLDLTLLSHYSAVLGIQAILSQADGFLRRPAAARR